MNKNSAALVAAVLLQLAACATVPPAPIVAHSYSGPKGVAAMYDAPCVDPKVLQHIPPEYQAQFKAGEGTYEGPKYALCWADSGELLLLVWEDGGFGRVPKNAGGVGT